MLFHFFKQFFNTKKIQQENRNSGNLSISDAELKTILDVSMRFARNAPPIDPNTENFIYGDKYRDIPPSAKLNFYLTGIGRLIEAEKAKDNLNNVLKKVQKKS